MRDLDEPREPGTFGVRFVFGAVFGAGVGFGLWAQALPEASRVAAAAVVGGAAIACGLLAARLGDRFWTGWVARWWWWT